MDLYDDIHHRRPLAGLWHPYPEPSFDRREYYKVIRQLFSDSCLFDVQEMIYQNSTNDLNNAEIFIKQNPYQIIMISKTEKIRSINMTEEDFETIIRESDRLVKESELTFRQASDNIRKALF